MKFQIKIGKIRRYRFTNTAKVFVSAECGVRSAECGVRSTEYGVRSTEYGVRIRECGVRSTECGVRSLSQLKCFFRFGGDF